MVRLPMDEDRLEDILEEQRKRREKDVSNSLPPESTIVEPAKRLCEEQELPKTGEIEWYEEPLIYIRERHSSETAMTVAERPDLICAWGPEGGETTTFYLIELKKKLGKKSLGQVLSYYWAMRNGQRIKSGDGEYEISGEEMLIIIIGYMELQQQYYAGICNWVKDAVSLDKMSGIKFVELEPE